MYNTYLDDKLKSKCNGCGVCALVCPKHCIRMIEDEEGFLYPEIDEKKCIKCNKCRKICGNYNDKNDNNEHAYAAINNSKEQLNDSSSGGMFYILAEYVINNNGVVFGVTYSENLEAIHEFATDLQECKKFQGSKYVRSNLKNSYEEVRNFLEKGKIVLFTGTACQISGLKKYLNKDYENLILCDILCHANPSPKVFKMYIENLQMVKNKKVKTIWFRSKENGWRNQTPIVEYEDGEKNEENSYFKAFVCEMINRPSCYSCQFASKRRITDFTIGDFWGINKVIPDLDESQGVSLLTVNSEKGDRLLEIIKEKMTLKSVDYDLACSFNHYHNVKEHKNREIFFDKVASGEINSNNIIKNMNKYTKRTIYEKVLGKLKRFIKNK